MFPLRTCAALPIATFAGAAALIPGVAAAQDSCTWYANTALQQQQANVNNKCGFSGAGWSLDLKAHAAWCASVSPEVWKKAARDRKQSLDGCLAKQKN